ncbi:MAG TPA: AsmA family protein [Verrucomicrobiae bacterium]|jgi:uncharacterized protein involved in outer membrane biogenesis|nr:AsmA family protein [Verrucomicrobiae bacterium]
MAEEKTEALKPGPRKRGSRWRVLAWVVAILVVLAVTFYFVVTSEAFLKVQVLPRVSRAIHAEVTVGSAEIHPFSEIVLRDLKVQPTNQPTILTAREVRARYRLWDILGGTMRVDELAVASPTIQVVENPDGTSNLDPLLKAREKTATGGKAAKPPKLDIRKVVFSNATVLQIRNQKVGTRDLVELTNVSVTLTGLRSGEPAKVEFAAIVRDENNPPAPAMYGLLQARVDGSFSFSLTPEFKPAWLLGDAHLDISQAAGSFSDFAKLDGTLHCDYSTAEIKMVTLSFEKAGTPLGELRASGPFDAQKSEGRLSVELLAVDRQVLNLFGAKNGIDFGATTITSTNEVELSKGGKAMAAVGQLSASKFQVSLTNQSTPPIDLLADYDVSLDKTEKRALVRTLNISGTQKGRALLRGELTSPMTLAWGNETNAVGDSSFSFAVTKLNIPDWKTFIGEAVSAGTVDLNLKLLSQQGGTRLTFDATNQIQNLAATIGGEHLSGATLNFKTHGLATNLKQFDLRDFGLQVARSNRMALTISGSGTYDRTNRSADLQVTVRAGIAQALQLLGRTNIAASGAAELTARVTQQRRTQTVAGTLTVTNFTGRIGANAFTNFGARMALEVSRTPEQIEIRSAQGALSQGRSGGGDFTFSGTYSLTDKPSQLTATFSNFNEAGLRPFVEPLLAGRKLDSVEAAGSVSAQRSANGDTAVKADLQVTNLVVNDAARQLPTAPLEARVQLDAGMAKKIADVRELQITLAPTQRAKNQLRLHGRVDMSQTNAMRGSLTLAGDSLDVTGYYDLFTATNQTAGKSGVENKSPSATAAPVPVPAAATNELPFRNFTVDAKVREFYLGEIAATNLEAHLQLDRSRILLRPLQLTINGSPVRGTADVDLSVSGYKYALTFNATNVPFAPLWNTFEPTEKGEMGGALSASVDVKGTGTTGESLQKTLKGSFDVGTTNLNLDVSKIRNGTLRDIVDFVANVPEFFGTNGIREAEKFGMHAVGRGFGKYSGGFADDVSRSPIEVITARGTTGDGRVAVQQAVLRSSVFEAETTNGTVTLARELTNSVIDFPIGISLNKTMAQRVPYLSSTNAVTNSDYVKIPDIYTEKGTIGNPKPSINVTALGEDVLQRLIPGMGGGTNSTGNLLEGIGGLLLGGANTNQPATNQPPDNYQSPVNELMNRFLGK